MCDWLANSVTTLHVTMYFEITNATVTGIGGFQTSIVGRGMVELESKYKGHTYAMTFTNILHIPSNKNNLISLERWDTVAVPTEAMLGYLHLPLKVEWLSLRGGKLEIICTR